MGRRLTWIVALGALLVLLPLAYAYITPNDPQYPGTTTTGQWNLRMIGVDKTWKHTRGAGVKVAIVGQGVPLDVDADAGKPSHPDAPVHYRSDLDGDTANAGDNSPHDAASTSGLIQLSLLAANTNNGIGIASIAPDADIFVIGALGGTGVNDVAEGVDLARTRGAQVILLGYTQTSLSAADTAAIDSALTAAVVVSSVGNGGPVSGTFVAVPGNYSSVIAVGSVDNAKVRSSFSNYNMNADEVDVMAPGTAVLAHNAAGAYGTFSGGSASSPHVAGVAALIYSHCAGKRALTPAEVRTAILANTELIAGKTGYDREYGNGLVRADLALEAFPECFVVAQNGSGSVMQGRSVGINLTATGGEGDTLTFQIQTQPAHGSVMLSGNTATYTPAAGYTGGDSFTFRALDPKPHASNTATVTVTVTPNTAPTVSTPTVTLAGVAASLSATASDADPGEVFTATIDWGDGGGMQTASVSGPNVTGTHTYTSQGAKTVTVCVRDLAQIPACASTTINVSAATTSNSADLVLSINTIPAETPLNQAVVITLSAKNLGPANANNVKVTTTLPTGSAIEPATSASCTAAAGGIVCSTSQLAPDASLAFTIAATAASAGEWHFSASATSDENDAVTSNNTVSAEVTILPANLGSLNVSTTPKKGCSSTDSSWFAALAALLLVAAARRRQRR